MHAGRISPSAPAPPPARSGAIDLHLYPITSAITTDFRPYTTAVFNLSHPRGSITDLGFSSLGNPVHIKASLDPANHYAITL